MWILFQTIQYKQDKFFIWSGETHWRYQNRLFSWDHVSTEEDQRRHCLQFTYHLCFGSNFQEVVQNVVFTWPSSCNKPGFVSYAGNAWNLVIGTDEGSCCFQNRVILKSCQKYPRVAGHSMWYYLRTNYGRSTVSNLLYLTRITRNFEKCEFVLNTPIRQIYEESLAIITSPDSFREDKFDERAGN